jgi:signal transduction histidine kinase
VNGLNAFFPDELTENTTPPEVVIVDVRLSHRSVQEYPELTGREPVMDLRSIDLDYDQSDVAFDYVALHFQNPSQNTYAYRLEGFDGDWVDAGSYRTATYTNLSPGTYTFRVRAANSDGVWNEKGASIEMTIEPPWWRTWWALAFYVVLLVGAIVGIHRMQSQRLLRAERERANQRELEDARTIEAAYKHLQETQDQLVQSQKMASLGHLTAGIAHEIRNPLNFVNNFTKLTREALDEFIAEFEKQREHLPEPMVTEFEEFFKTVRYNTDRVREHGGRADAVVKNMLRHSLSSKSERHPTDLNGLLNEYSRLVQRSNEARYPDMRVTVVTKLDSRLGRIDVVPQDIGRVFTNILDNAYEALREKLEARDVPFDPTIWISTEKHQEEIEIRVADNGPGIDPSIRSKVFDPFFTTKEAGHSAGLGLSMSYEIVAAHGGVLAIEEAESGGTVVVIRLPT